MGKKKFLFVFILVFLGLGLPGFIEEKYFSSDQAEKGVLGAVDYREQKADTDWTKVEVKGGIIPHDIRQEELIIHFLEGVKNQNPETIVLLAPNHQERGSGQIITSGRARKTPLGLLEANQELIEKLKKQGVREDEEALVFEPAIQEIAPYIKRHLPAAEIVPLIFKSGINLEKLNNIKKELGSIINRRTIIIAAVDFSHYLPAQEADQRDVVTKKAIITFDHQTILSFGQKFNEYLDSPPAVALLLMLMEEKAEKAEILDSVNSGYLSGDLSGPSTSYFEAVYY